MIAALRGEISDKLPDSLVLEVGGVGYELFVTADDWGAAAAGQIARFHVYEQIREDAHNLYGFSQLGAKQLFVQLVGVNGVGPKLALQILSAAGEKRLRQAIASGDPALLKGISGVGPKTAQRVILDLRGKVEEGAVGLAPVADSTYQALVALGYTPAQATEAVAALPPDVTDEQARVKLALKGAGKR
ncbi:MAG TPA: Holliday junction branch migration protein RuvA [Candidatus Saccharimonadia bacterium]|nr:Holliday junction branch migration protein RuvA [Candidatus Saccharimonadia bacterium]